jgi:predicted nucleic acid-binding protein
VKHFLDTSVLVSAFHVEHPHHQPSFELFVGSKRTDSCCALHSLAEIYATLTRMPTPRRASGDQALLYIGNIRERFTIVTLDEQEYSEMLESSAGAGLIGGAIYDAILGHCALKAGARTIYTWNTRDFLRLPHVIATRVKRPDEAPSSARH